MKLNHNQLSELLSLDDDRDDWYIDDGQTFIAYEDCYDDEYQYIDGRFEFSSQDDDEYQYIPKGLSDLDTNEMGLPMAEWDDGGRYWVTYDSEEDRDLALDFNAAEWEHYNRIRKG